MSPGECAACSIGLGICSAHCDQGTARDETRGEQGPTVHELEISKLRAENRHLREAMLAVLHAVKTEPKWSVAIARVTQIATDTLQGEQ